MLTLLAVMLLAQVPVAPPATDGVITGQVVDAATGKPVSAAIVTVSGSAVPRSLGIRDGRASNSIRILTGADGRFVFRELALGNVNLSATKNGYADGAPGRRRPGGVSQDIVLTAAQKTADLVIRVWKNGAIAGTVIDEAGEPVIGVRVAALVRSSSGAQAQFTPTSAVGATDDRGIYRFSNLPAGDYLVLVAPPLISVRAAAYEDVAMGRVNSEMNAALLMARSTDMVLSGDAVVLISRGMAMPPSSRAGRLQIYPPTMYPAATTPAQASIVSLGGGEERAGIDIQLTPVPTAHVSGMVLGAAGPAAEVRLQLIPARGNEVPGELLAAASVTDSTGAFIFAAVPPGQYTLRATKPDMGPGGMQTYWVEMPISIGGEDVDGVTALLLPPLRITARLQFEGNTPPPPVVAPQFTNLFSLDPADFSQAPVIYRGTVENGNVTLTGTPPGRYRVRVSNSPPGWMFKSAMLNGVDVSETPFDVTRDVSGLVLTFTDRWSGMSGSVTGAGLEGATVLVFTTDTQLWRGSNGSQRRIRSARTKPNGEFAFASLPPGDYYVTAIRDEDAADWRAPATLEALARAATQVTIVEGEHKTITVQVREVRR